MFAEVHTPSALTGKDLDDYLAQGWFRMGQSIFTTNFLHFKDQYYSAIWLRVRLSDWDGENDKLAKRNAIFKTQIQPALLTIENEELFLKYKQSVSFETSSSLHTLLFGKALLPTSIYNTYQINIRDGDKLIATGFFDLGNESAAGIISFYDPEYKKYSLGKYLILLKMKYCKKLNKHYFYPGYFVPGYPLFDYKLSISKTGIQYFNLVDKQWLSINKFENSKTPLQVMHDNLLDLQQLLNQAKIAATLLNYEFFDVNLTPELKGMELFDFPLFLQCQELPEKQVIIVVVFNILSNQFHLIECRCIWESNLPSNDTIYTSHLLKAGNYKFSTRSVEEMAATIYIQNTMLL